MRYPRPLQVVHWTVAILVTCQLAIAVLLVQLRSLEYGQFVLALHRQLGLAILLLVLARLVLSRRYPAPSQREKSLPPWQIHTAAIVHWMFLTLLVAQPVVGVLIAWARGDTVTLFGLLRLPALLEIADAGRERLLSVHIAIAVTVFTLSLLHIGAVVFNHVVRRVPVIERMLPAASADRLVNRIPIATQFTLAFGLVTAIALFIGVNAISTYREFNRLTVAFEEGEISAADQTRAAQVSWKELTGLALAGHGSESAGRIRELADLARSSLEEAAAHTPAGEVRTGLARLIESLPRSGAGNSGLRLAALQDVDTHLQDIVDSQSAAAFQHRTDHQQEAARGHDLIVVTLLPMILAGLIVGLLLARSVNQSLNRMGRLVRSIEADQRDAPVDIVGGGEFATLTREIVSMRATVEQRGSAAAAERVQFETERARVADEQQRRDAATERRQRSESDAHREQFAANFEILVAGIVDTVAHTAVELTTTASSMAVSASNTTQRSRDASSVADQTSGTASLIATSTAELSTTAQSVRQNAEKSRAQAMLAVREAAAAKDQIDHLVAAARQIGTITDMIDGVARQTHLLAINARIEAARAGEAGYGFSVVADEVKGLAAQTRGATIGIGKQIEQVTGAAARSSESLQRLHEVIEGLEEAASAIFMSAEEQFASTRDIAKRTSEISASTRSVAQNIRDAGSTAGTTEEMSAEVVRAAQIVDEQAVDLREQVKRFLQQLRTNGAPPGTGASAVGRIATTRQLPARRAISG